MRRRSGNYPPPELRERAVRMVAEVRSKKYHLNEDPPWSSMPWNRPSGPVAGPAAATCLAGAPHNLD
jgi:hypothetical protein